MPGKQMEGNPEQRRKAAREAREAGKRPSEVGATRGASKQRKHVGDAEQPEKIETIREGKLESAMKGNTEIGPRSKRRMNSEHPATRHRHL